MPLSVGTAATGMDIEPFTSIKRYAPLCYWRMDEASGTLVNSGSAASKNATATALTYTQTKIATRSPKTSVSFNGSTSFAEVAAGVIGGVNPTFSIGCWVRTSASIAQALICQRDGTNGGSGFEFKLSGAYISFQGVTTAGVNDFSMSSNQVPTLDDGVNHYVSATVYSNTVAIYMDGIEVGNYGGRSGGTWSATPKIFLGQISGGTQRFNGFMSDAFITTQVLTQADHYKIWRNGMLNVATPKGSNFLDAVEISVPVAETTISSFDFSNYAIEPPLEPTTLGIGAPIPSYPKGVNGGKSAWFKFTSVSAGDRFRWGGASVPDSTTYHYVEVFKDTNGTISGLQKLAQYLSYTRIYNTLLLEAATTYYVRIMQYYDFPNIIDFTYHYDTPPPPPANDDFADAITLNTTTSGSIAVQLDGSTIEFPLETDNYTAEANSVWYKFVADATGDITFDTAASAGEDVVLQGFNDMVLADLEADPYMAPWFDNDSGPSGTVLMTMSVVSGNTYYLQMSGYSIGGVTMAWTDII